MRRSRRRRGVSITVVVTAVVLASLAGAAVVLARALTRHGTRHTVTHGTVRALSIVCRSPSLRGTEPADVYLPPGYSARGGRYPVIYFLHGLPAGPQSYHMNGFVSAALAAAGERAIVVAPQGSRSADSDREYLDWDPQENWPAAISRDLPACIDARFHTIADRYGRALIGLSAGGYGAMNIGLRALPRFGAVESWSGYFAATDPSGRHILSFSSAQAQAAATVPTGPALRTQLASHPTFVGFYVGSQDGRFLPMNRQYDASLRHSGIAHTFAVYPGGHQYSLWRAHARQWLTLALRFLSAGRHRRSGRGGSGR